MNSYPDDPDLSMEALRSNAEKRVEPPGLLKRFSANQKLLHELQVHKVELEMQNDELIKSRSAAELRATRYTELYDFAPLGYFTLSRKGVIRAANLEGAKLLGLHRTMLIGHPFPKFVQENDLNAFKHFLERVFSREETHENCELTILNSAGGLSFVQISGVVDSVEDCCLVAVTDLSQQKHDQDELEISASVYQAIGEAVVIADPQNTIISVNPAFTTLTGYSSEEAVGQTTKLLKSGQHDKAFYQKMWDSIDTLGEWKGQILNKRKNGEIYPESLSITNIYDEKGHVRRRVALFTDLTAQREAANTIWNQANYDLLTGMPNRRLFLDRLKNAFYVAERNKLPMAVLFIDLDHFKEVNDTLGHHKGDILLKEAAQRIIQCVRESDTVSRFGGDEFTILLPNIDNMNRVNLIAQQILDSLQLPYDLSEKEESPDSNKPSENALISYISASIGITIYPNDGKTGAELLKHADQALYAAKNVGRNCYEYFTHSLQETAEIRNRVINDLYEALSNQEFRVYYQPIVDLTSGEIYKAEALVRWQHPKRGLVSPDAFIPIAEETRMIIGIGDWVFHQAAQQAKYLRQFYHPDFQVSVNMSPVQFNQPVEKGKWVAILQRYEIDGQGICIEITEGLLLNKSEHVANIFDLLSEYSIDVSLDDFGTGYSSLSYLKKFNIDYLKIDQSFVRDLENDSDNIALCEAIIVMAHKLNIKVIAEGVETKFQRDFLKKSGCDYAQGYLYSKPVPADEFERLLNPLP